MRKILTHEFGFRTPSRSGICAIVVFRVAFTLIGEGYFWLFWLWSFVLVLCISFLLLFCLYCCLSLILSTPVYESQGWDYHRLRHNRVVLAFDNILIAFKRHCVITVVSLSWIDWLCWLDIVLSSLREFFQFIYHNNYETKFVWLSRSCPNPESF